MPKPSIKRAKLAELRALRESGKKRLDSYELQQEVDIYEEVDEESYKKLIRDRLNQDDFVIDDNGLGYADDGREEWDRLSQDDSECEKFADDGNLKKAATKLNQQEKTRLDRGISDYFIKGSAAIQLKPKSTTTKADNDFLNELLIEVDSHPRSDVIPAQVHKSNEKRQERELSPPIDHVQAQSNKRAKIIDTRFSNINPTEFFSDDDWIVDKVDVKQAATDVLQQSSPTKDETLEDNLVTIKNEDSNDEDMMEVSQIDGVAIKNVNVSAIQPISRIQKAEAQPSTASPPSTLKPAIDVDASSWNCITEKLNIINKNQPEVVTSFGKLDHNDAIEEDGSLLFYWIDYIESNGSLCLFGKVRNKKSGSYVSSFLKIDNILRKLFFLPRKYREGSNDEIGMKDVYEEVDTLMTKLKVGMHKIKMCSRKYAFELPNIPKEEEYLKLFYPYSKPQLQNHNQTGSSYSHVFGTNTPLFEQFVLWKKIKGPCWLKIDNAEYGVLKNASHCKLEVQISVPNDINPVSENNVPDNVPITMMSIAMRTALNVKENNLEIIAISARTYQDMSLIDTTSPEKLPCQSFTIIRPILNAFPLGFQAEIFKRNAGGQMNLVRHEKELLSLFLARLAHIDPDVILGHQLEGFDLSVLLNRLQVNKTPQWSRIGRMSRSQWPGAVGNSEGSLFVERSIISGRLLCDLANDMGKSMMTKCSSWSLTEMCSLYLTDKIRRDIDNEQALKTWASTKNGLIDYIHHCEADTFFIAALAIKIQMLPLTKILTNLAGNSWARTLTGTRAERNEYILLHEFHRKKYICPDKAVFTGRQKFESESLEENVDIKKKDKYKGGLVFEPEKGLYDKYVLVMDFNSLYPSIIQEFNICFTTVDRTRLSEDEEQVPEVPINQSLGILPKLISTLVNRRRQVKSSMKDRNATSEQLATWDIKQLALKLTANSMYGCLGYTKSRFYARPLAVLTTYKGREILRSTKDLAESNSLQVIYGDTDSVMINANVNNIEDALNVGREFKKAVNDRYKLLEIDIDNIFRRILLQAKKKYAAINLVPTGGTYVEKMEVKGLDMKRREYCNLSKEVSSKLLNEILSGDESEQVISRIHDHLRNISEDMRNNNVPVSKYIIYTKLGKAPKYYLNADNVPQVQVALRELSRGKIVRKDDVIAYIVTGDSKSSSESVAKRSYSPQDVIKADSGLSPDIEWYLRKQIFPPVERLCANISGTDNIRLAECLGLDIKKYSINNNISDGGNQSEICPLESQIDDEIRFKDASRLTFYCRSCKMKFAFEGLKGSIENCSSSGIVCLCNYKLPDLSIMAQLEHQIREHSSKYYEGWLVCDDKACENRTRQMSVYGSRCLGPQALAHGCLGKMRFEFTEKMMYNQLLYFATLFDVEKAISSAQGPNKERILALAEHNRIRFSKLKSVVERYLDKNGRRWVAMDSLFGRLGFSS